MVAASLTAAACGESDTETTSVAQPSGQPPTSATQPAPYPVTVSNCGVDYTFAKAPDRVVSPSVPGTELMLALGLERRLAGVVGATSAISPDLQPRMNGVNIITERTFPPPGKEAILSANPDFLVSGYSEDFAETAIGDRASLKSLGVNSYLVQGKCGDGKVRATLGDTYADIENLGRIFDVRPVAATLVSKLKAEAGAATPAASKPKVLIYAAGKEKPSTSGAMTLVADLVAQAGGQNVLPEIPGFGTFDWETVVERNPDVILVVTTGSFPLASATEFLSSYAPVADVNAVKNKRIVSVGVNDVQPGVRNGRALAEIARGLSGG